MQLMKQVGLGIMQMNNLMKEAGLLLSEFSKVGVFILRINRIWF